MSRCMYAYLILPEVNILRAEASIFSTNCVGRVRVASLLMVIWEKKNKLTCTCKDRSWHGML